MKRETYMFGVRGEQYGIWNAIRKCWQFGICEDTPMLAVSRLFQKSGTMRGSFGLRQGFCRQRCGRPRLNLPC